MKTYTDQELRELDAWVAEHVMGWLRVDGINHLDNENRFCVLPDRILIGQNMGRRIVEYSPSTDSAASMQVLKKCAERLGSCFVGVAKLGDDCMVFAPAFPEYGFQKAETLELAICLFAKQLFSK